MKKIFVLCCFAFLTSQMSFAQTPKVEFGKVERFSNVISKNVDARNVDVWLPEGYDPKSKQKYPVLYMHDGQNIFDPTLSYGGAEWDVDGVFSKLIRENKIKSCIVVGIWNTPKRFIEYAPKKIFDLLPEERKAYVKQEFGATEPLSDAYLKFIVEELKPFIDKTYKTLPQKENTFIMGSSMGGLISFYAIMEYPHVFGGAGCVSSHWPFSRQANNGEFTKAAIKYMNQKGLSKVGKLYFDYGTTTLDAWYEEHQLLINEAITKLKFPKKKWTCQKFEGAAHNEKSWNERLHIPAEFLLKK